MTPDRINSRLQRLLIVPAVCFFVALLSFRAFGAQVVVDAYSDVVPYVSGYSQFTVGGLTLGGSSTELKVFVFAEIFRDGAYHIVGAIDNYSIREKYPNGYGVIRPKTGSQWGLLDGERPDRYIAGIDYNGDDRIGLWDAITESMTFDSGEYVPSEYIAVSGEPAFREGFGFQLQSISIVPEPSTLCLMTFGFAVLLRRRNRGQSNRSESVRLRYCPR